MEAQALHDIQLVGRAAAGDQRAFAELFDRHAGIVLGVLTKLLHRRELAEEILQETFFQAWKQADRYRPERATPRAWLLMLARARAIDRIRSRSSRRKREETVAAPVDVDAVGTRRLETSETRTDVANALEILPEEQRRSIELAFYRGLTHTEIASELELPLGTVKSRIALGMRKMREALTS